MDAKKAAGLINNESGYCLWIGAGVAKYLASTSLSPPPLWEELVVLLENLAGITKPPFKTTFPERLNITLNKLHRADFARKIRNLIVDRLSLAILEEANKHIDEVEQGKKNDLVPKTYFNIASLGKRANQIVNFNIETMTSHAIAGSTSSYAIKVFNPPLPRSADNMLRDRISQSLTFPFCRPIYHPHGAIDIYGSCLLTSKEYQSLNGTLALQLATHTAFDSDLFIIGMSLDDDYLCSQLASFRRQIRKIYWFTDSIITNTQKEKWIWEHQIEVCNVTNWDDVWNNFGEFSASMGNHHIPKENLLTGWHMLICQALGNLNGAYCPGRWGVHPDHQPTIDMLIQNMGLIKTSYDQNEAQAKMSKFYDYFRKNMENLGTPHETYDGPSKWITGPSIQFIP